MIKKTVFRGRNKFLRRAKVITEIGFVATGQRHHGAMMKIVVPHSVQIVAAFAARSRHLGILEIVLGDEDDGVRAGRFPRCAPNSADDVFTGSIADGMCRVEAEPVEMKFLNPITPIRYEKLANWT